MTVFSVGHSTHEPAEFARLARGVDVLIDVRSHPTSHWPQWRFAAMRSWVPALGMDLLWAPDLGGWTSRHLDLAEQMATHGVDLDAYAKGHFPKGRIGKARTRDKTQVEWHNQGLYDYSWYTTTRDFSEGILSLIERFGAPDQPRAALLCCEALWWKCHRSIIADVLLHRWSIDTLHIKSTPPRLAASSRFVSHRAMIGNRIARYDPQIPPTW